MYIHVGKAIGLAGSFVCTNKLLKNLLINKARGFVFSTAPSPLLAALLKETLDYVLSKKAESARGHLQKLCFRFKKNLIAMQELLIKEKLKKDSNVKASPFLKILKGDPQYVSPIFPFFLFTEEASLKAALNCQEMGFDIRAIRPPTVPKGGSRLRISLHASHREKDIERLIALPFSKSQKQLYKLYYKMKAF